MYSFLRMKILVCPLTVQSVHCSYDGQYHIAISSHNNIYWKAVIVIQVCDCMKILAVYTRNGRKMLHGQFGTLLIRPQIILN